MQNMTHLPHEAPHIWFDMSRRLNDALPEDIQTVSKAAMFSEQLVKGSLGITAIIRIYLILCRIMEYKNNSDEQYYAIINTSPAHVCDTIRYNNAETIIFSKMYESSQRDVLRGVTDIQRLTALEERIKKRETDQVKIFTKDNNFVILFNNKIYPNQLYEIISTHYAIIKRRKGYEFSMIDRFLKALREKDLDVLNIIINEIPHLKILEKLKFEQYKKIFTPPAQAKLDNYSNKLEQIMRELRDLEKRYRKRLEEYDEQNTLYEATLKASIEVDIDSIMKHIDTCPYIERYEPYVTSEGTGIKLYYYAPLLCYDELSAERKKFGASENAKKIFEVFAHHKDEYELWTECQVLLLPSKRTLEAFTHKCEHKKRIGHPHVNYYGCKGNHIGFIEKELTSGDYKKAINQISEMVLEINFADGIVIRNFIKTLHNYNELKVWKKKSTNEFISTKQLLKEVNNGETQTNN